MKTQLIILYAALAFAAFSAGYAVWMGRNTDPETITFAAAQPPKGTTFTLIIWHPHLAAIKPAEGWTYTSEPMEGCVKITATKE